MQRGSVALSETGDSGSERVSSLVKALVRASDLLDSIILLSLDLLVSTHVLQEYV